MYAISGVAVNHTRNPNWNPNYRVEADTANIGTLTPDVVPVERLIQEVVARLGETGEIRSTFRPDPNTLQLFTDDKTITADLTTGKVTLESVSDRVMLRKMNFLHLNTPGALWTYIADLYAVALAVLAVTGMLVVKGRKGIQGRGAWLVTAGVAIPVVFLILYF